MVGGCGVGKKEVVGKKGGAWAPAPCPSRPTVLATPLLSPHLKKGGRRSSALLPPAIISPPYGSPAFAEDDDFGADRAQRMTVCWDISTVVIPSHPILPRRHDSNRDQSFSAL